MKHNDQATTHHVPALDGVRGLAIATVLLGHGVGALGIVPPVDAGIWWANAARLIFFPGGWGVDVFFTLSGFLITGILLRTRTNATYLTSFYARRALRIFPVYYIALILDLVVVHFTGNKEGYIPAGTTERVSYFLYIQNWPIFWPDWSGMRTLWGAYWSLAVEEQFYLVWPAIVQLLSWKTVLRICAFGFLVEWPVRWAMFHHYGSSLGVMQAPFTRLDGLFLGAAIALYRAAYERPVPLRWAAWAGIIGVGLYLCMAFAYTREIYGLNAHHMWTTCPTAVVLMGGSVLVMIEHRVEPVIHFFSWTPLLVAGRISYGMYVYHLAVYAVMEQLWYRVFVHHASQALLPLWATLYIGLAVAIVAAIAAFSYRWIEAPILRFKRFFPSQAPLV
jgi:peptidoglycan/LPS O-acetylase OafA/YrhL